MAALLLTVALSGPAGFVIRKQSAEAAFLAEVKKLLASDAQPGDHFGQGLAISGDTAFVAAPGSDAGGVRSGAVYVLQRDQGGQDNWGEVKKLTASDARAYGYFGPNVAASGDTAGRRGKLGRLRLPARPRRRGQLGRGKEAHLVVRGPARRTLRLQRGGQR